MLKSSSSIIPVIIGISSTKLTEDEKQLFKERKPLGFILFERNCESSEQIKNLVSSLKETVGYDCPILIDQEGGRVRRLKEKAGFQEFRAPQTFKTVEDVYKNADLMAKQLKDLGISVNCTPLADLVFDETHSIIGDRSFGKDPEFVGKMAASVMKAHFDNGIVPIIKHIPGHGRAIADSHEELPIVKEDISLLEQTDFKAFKIALDILKPLGYPIPWAMTAHIIYQKIDPFHCATHSKKIISTIIRNHIGFDGFLISDCITMKALSGSFPDRVRKSLSAGCDAVLHCSGVFSEIQEVLKKSEPY